MPFQYIRIGLTVVAVAVVTYIFFPGVKHGNVAGTAGHRHDIARSAAATPKSTMTAQATHANSKSALKTARQPTKSSSAQTIGRIEPDTRLREKQASAHSGPPSKMYGGM